MCPDANRHFTEWCRRNDVQDNENIASGTDTNRSLGQSKKGTKNQQLLDRPNKIVPNDKSKVMKINNALTPGDKDYFGYEYNKEINDIDKPTTVRFANTNSSLVQSKKGTENQQLLDRPNKIVLNDKSKVMKINNALTPGDKDYFGYEYYKTVIEKLTIDCSKFVTKIKTHGKFDIFNTDLTEMLSSKTARHRLGFDYSHEITRPGKTTLPVAAVNDLHKPAVTGKTGNQLKQSNVTRGTDSQISFRSQELKTSLDLEQKPNFPNDSDENLNSKPVATDEPSGIGGSPAVSTGNDETTSDGEASMDSDYDFEVMKLFAWLDKKDWARSYYDCDDGVVIHVEPGQVEASQRLLTEAFPDFHKYKVVETEPGICTYSADRFEEDEGHKHVGCKLQPGDIITSDEHLARFSGRVGSKGLTVAHIGPSNNIYHYSNDRQHLIGTMEKVLEVNVSFTNGRETIQRRTTADLGLLDLTGHCRVKNVICYKGIYRLKLYNGSIKKGTMLRIIDQYGVEKHGELKSNSFNLDRNRQDSSLGLVGPNVDDWSREVYNTLRIQNKKRAISAEGDSGTLVTSIPKEGSNEVFVYGIVTHLHEQEQQSATIANRLFDVLDTIDISGRSVGLRDPSSKKIDFTEDEI